MKQACVEVLLEGPRDTAKAFVVAFVRGRGGRHDIVDLEQEDFDCETLRERLGDLLRPDHTVSHLLVAAEDLVSVRDAVRDAEAHEIPAKIVAERPIAEARFTYDVEVFFPVLAQRIRDLFTDLPPGVHVHPEHEFEEERVELDGGKGMYAPVHPYRFRGDGIVCGAPFPVVSFWRRCLEEPAIEVRGARVVAAEKAP